MSKLEKKVYWFPLTADERKRIQNNEVINKHFHQNLPNQVLMVFVGKTKVSKDACVNLLAGGWNATSIVLTKQDLDKIEKGDGVFAQYSDFEVGIIPQESMDKLQKKWGFFDEGKMPTENHVDGEI